MPRAPTDVNERARMSGSVHLRLSARLRFDVSRPRCYSAQQQLLVLLLLLLLLLLELLRSLPLLPLLPLQLLLRLPLARSQPPLALERLRALRAGLRRSASASSVRSRRSRERLLLDLPLLTVPPLLPLTPLLPLPLLLLLPLRLAQGSARRLLAPSPPSLTWSELAKGAVWSCCDARGWPDESERDRTERCSRSTAAPRNCAGEFGSV